MIVIACVDDRMGMLFNRRRQSQDAALRQRLLERAAGRPIWMSEYSARQFADCQADNIRVSDHCADQAGAGELWFGRAGAHRGPGRGGAGALPLEPELSRGRDLPLAPDRLDPDGDG